ncbi:MAG: hypothetical protein K0V04_01375 [Deltaproteobacteria bacterium]|nr:hypothetical protein [Deltaproteobacteria bacterium]
MPAAVPTFEEQPASAPRALVSDAMWSLMGEGLYAAGLFATLVLLARLGSVQALGQYTLGMAIATPAILLTNFHLRPAFVVDPGRWHYAQYLSLRLLTVPCALVLTAIAASMAGLEPTTVAVVVLVGGLRGLEALSDILLAPAQKAERMASIGRSRALRGVLTASGIGVGLAITGDIVVALGLALVLLAGLSALHDIPAARRFASVRPKRPTRALLGLARHTLPIGLAAALLAASANTPAYVLEHEHDVATLGYFGAAMSAIYFGQVLNVALGNAAIPRLARKTTREGLRSLLGRLLLVVAMLNALVLLGALVLGELYLGMIYGEDYVAYAPELVLASAAAGVAGLANMLSQALTALGRFTDQLMINLVSLGGSVLVAIWLVPGGGLRGAMWALLALAVLRLAIYGVALSRATPRTPEARET